MRGTEHVMYDANGQETDDRTKAVAARTFVVSKGHRVGGCEGWRIGGTGCRHCRERMEGAR